MTAAGLRLAGEDDHPFLYRLAIASGPAWYRVGREGLAVAPAFTGLLWSGVLALFVVEVDATPVGAVSVYDWFPHHGVLSIDAPMLEPTDPAVTGAAVARAVDAVAARVPFRRLYAEYPVFARPPIDHLGPDFEPPVRDATRRDAVYWDGWYWDLAIDRIERAVPVDHVLPRAHERVPR